MVQKYTTENLTFFPRDPINRGLQRGSKSLKGNSIGQHAVSLARRGLEKGSNLPFYLDVITNTMFHGVCFTGF